MSQRNVSGVVIEMGSAVSVGPFGVAGSNPAVGPLAVVVVTYNSSDVLSGLLDSLPLGLEGISPCEIIIVDNDSSDASVDIARSHPTRPRVIATGRNGGFAAGINVATRTIGDDVAVMVLNPDTRLSPGIAHQLMDSMERSGSGMVVPRIVDEDGTLACSLRREPSVVTAWSEALLGGRVAARLGIGEMIGRQECYRHDHNVDWATGAALMISAEARRRVGEWDESFFLYSEEVDYMRRVREAGLTVDYVSEAKAVHIGGDYESSPFLSALMTTNRIRDFARTHGSVSTAWFWLGVIVGAGLRSGFGPSQRARLRAALSVRNVLIEDERARAAG